jgi:hypothetical protein
MGGEGQVAHGGVGGSSVTGRLSERQSEQYSLAKILGVWAAAVLPMGVLAWGSLLLWSQAASTDPYP